MDSSKSSSGHLDLIEKGKRAYLYPGLRSVGEFIEDLSRARYIKRLVNRKLRGSVINDMLLLNHVVIWFNTFDTKGGMEILLDTLGPDGVPVLLAFTDFLNLTSNKAEYIQRCPETVAALKRI